MNLWEAYVLLVHNNSLRGTDIREKAIRTRTLLQAFYAYTVLRASSHFESVARHWTEGASLKAKLHLDILSGISEVHWPALALLATSGAILSGAALVIRPDSRTLRITLALSLLVFLAIDFDRRGKIFHSDQLTIWTAIASCLLPRSTSGDLRFVCSFFGIHVLLGTIYSCAGLSKLAVFLLDWDAPTTWFGHDALPLIIAENWRRSKTALLGGFFVVHPGLAQVAQVGAFGLELLALPAFLFAQTRRLWGLALVALHTVIMATLEIHFHDSSIILLLFVVASPFGMTPRTDSSSEELMRSRQSVSRLRLFDFAWPPALTRLYLVFAFGPALTGARRLNQEVFPFSPMPMFSRIPSGQENVDKLRRLRASLHRKGLFPRQNQTISGPEISAPENTGNP